MVGFPGSYLLGGGFALVLVGFAVTAGFGRGRIHVDKPEQNVYAVHVRRLGRPGERT